MMDPFLLSSHPLLNEKASYIPQEMIVTEEVQRDVDAVLAAAESQRQGPEGTRLVGLAAPQIGIAKRIIVVDDRIGSDNKRKGTLKVYINPEMIRHSEAVENDQEDCYSVHPCIFGIVPRYSTVVIRAYDRLGQVIEEEHRGYTARIFQHEIDHLNGLRFPDRIGPEGLLHWVKENEFPLYLHQWSRWQQSCPWDLWLALKKGDAFTPPD